MHYWTPEYFGISTPEEFMRLNIMNSGLLVYLTIITILTLSWYEIYQKTVNLNIGKREKDKKLVNMKIVFWIINIIAYSTYLILALIF